MSGFLIQSRIGTKGNFEVVLPGPDGGLVYVSRDNDVASLPWSSPITFATSVGQFSGTSLIESRFGDPPGNLEVVAVARNQLFHFWRDESGKWSDPGLLIAENVNGMPGLIQSNGMNGNFEVVVPAADRGLIHVSRNNSAKNFPWSSPTNFCASLGQISGVSLIQSNLRANPGSLEVVAIPQRGGCFAHLSRTEEFGWNEPTIVPGEIFHGAPGLIQSRLGDQRNFEVVVPNGLAFGVSHFWRDNAAPNVPWKYGTTFGDQVQVIATSLIESNFGDVGNLEVVAASMFWTHAFHVSRNDEAQGFPWSSPTILY